MAELEVVKHTKAIYKTVNDPHSGWKHKLKETLLEIGIIVFAITLSLWLHNWSEHNHVKQEEKEFLTGLKDDIQRDLIQLKAGINTYREVKKGLQYFKEVGYGVPLQQDSLRQYRWIFYSTTHFTPGNSRFEGLKASGKLGIIENKELLKNILELYQEDIPWLIRISETLNTYKRERLEPTISTFLILDKYRNGNWEQVLRKPQVQNLFIISPGAVKQIQEQYESVIAKYNKVLTLIARETKA